MTSKRTPPAQKSTTRKTSAPTTPDSAAEPDAQHADNVGDDAAVDEHGNEEGYVPQCRASDDCPRAVNPDFHGLCDTHWVTRPDLRKA